MTNGNSDSSYDDVGLRELNNGGENDNSFGIVGRSDSSQRRDDYKQEENGEGIRGGGEEGGTAQDGSSSSSAGMLHFVKKLLPQPSHAFRKKGRKRKTTQIASAFANDDDNDDSRKLQRLLPTTLLALAGESGLVDSHKDGCVSADVIDVKKTMKYDETTNFDGNNHEEADANGGSGYANASMTQSENTHIILSKQDRQQHQLQQQTTSNQQNQQQQHVARHQQLQQQRQNSEQQLQHRFHCPNNNDKELVQQTRQQKIKNLTPTDDESYSDDNDGKIDSEGTETPLDNASTMIAAGDEKGRGEDRSSDHEGVHVSSTPTRPILDNQKLDHHPSQQQAVQQRRPQPTQIQTPTTMKQPPGWRVKLYRLNIDGTWDDCGTGRIQFYFARHQQQQKKPRQQHLRPEQQQEDQGNDEGSSGDDQAEEEMPPLKERAPLHNSTSSAYFSSHPISAFQELGEPMLCMRAEIPLMQEQDDEHQQQEQPSDDDSYNSDSRKKSSIPMPCQLRVLLRTRVLLHDSAYQCQGGNIITWCEPFGASQQKPQKESDDGSQSHPTSTYSSAIVTGVDLALSFQDNAGCKDIWQNILNVQVRARELLTSNNDFQYEMITNAPNTRIWGKSSCAEKNSHNPDQRIRGLGASVGVGANGGVVAEDHAQQKLLHLHHDSTSQDRSPLSPKHHSPPQPQHHYHYSLHISPNSPDHDAMEDRQLSLVYSSSGHQSLSLPPRPPLLLVREAAASVPSLSSLGGIGGGGTMHYEKQNQNHEMHVHTHNSIAKNKNESSYSQEEHHQEDMIAVSMAAAAAAASYRAEVVSVTSGQFAGTRPASPSIDSSYTGDRESKWRAVVDCDYSSALISDRSHETRLPLHSLHQKEFQSQQQQHRNQHGFSIDIDSTSSSSFVDCNAPENTNHSDNDANSRPITRLSLPSNNPTWSDMPSLRDYISNFQFGGGAGGYQPMNISLLQREELFMYLALDDYSNLRKILRLFHDGRTNHGDEYSGSRREEEEYKLLASIIKSILLLNDPEIIEYVTTDAPTFELSCAILEYDPELRAKADHVNFLCKHATFHTVVPMDDDDGCGELVMNIHRLFRVNYLRDVILRPTMDESNLSALVSLGQFTMNDIIRGVMVRRLPMIACAVKEEVQFNETESGDSNDENKFREDTASTSRSNEDENYFTRIIRVFGTEIHFIRNIMWKEGCNGGKVMRNTVACVNSRYIAGKERFNDPSDSPPASSPSKSSQSEAWQQHVAPQDTSLSSRMIRRKGCVMFLNELFNMARMSLQQHEKDDFIEAVVGTTISLLQEDSDDVNEWNDARESSSTAPGEVNTSFQENDDERDNIENRDPRAHPSTHATKTVMPSQGPQANLLSLLSATLSDPTTDAKERCAALDILSVITMHDPSLIRKYCLDYAASTASVVADHQAAHRPEPNNLQEVLFACSPDDLILALLYVMATEVDAGLLLQTSEIIRIVLDTEMDSEQFGGGPLSPRSRAGGGGFLDDEYDMNVAYSSGNSGQPSVHEQVGRFGGGDEGEDAKSIESEQNAFLALFYDRYVHWLVAPFQFAILVPRLATPISMNGGVPSNTLRHEFKARKSISNSSVIGFTEDVASPSLFCPIAPCPVRASFTLEILCFCARAHVHRMKFFVLRSRMLMNIVRMLGRHEEPLTTGPMLPSGIRCLKLASLK